MEEHLTTRQVAEALKVSESSVKRWCNSGAIPTERTLGGHRRIPLSGFMQFLEKTNRHVVSSLFAEANGATAERSSSSAIDCGEASLERFRAALIQGEESVCRQILTAAFARDESMAKVADDYIARTMLSLGDLWDCGELDVYQERRGCEIAAHLIYELGRLLPEPSAIAPLALGGAPSGDQYSLPTQLVQLVLREAGWRAMNLGINLPIETLVAAVQRHHPKLVWLSCSHLDDEQCFVRDFRTLRDSVPDETVILIGGRALNDKLRPKLDYTSHCDNMQQLASFARAISGRRHSLESSEN